MRIKYSLVHILLSLAVLVVTALAVNAQDPSTFDGTPKEQLVERSWTSTSETEKGIIRSYLARKYPNAAEGSFSKAWLAGYEGRREESVKLYRDCLAQYPDFLPRLYNL